MDFKQIKELINLINDSDIGELQLEDKDFKLRIRHQKYHPKVTGGAHVIARTESAEEQHAPVTAGLETGSGEPAADEAEANENLITVKSPMIGTFYRASGPDKLPYVKVGDHVDKEDVLCIIEAMKLFNEIESEVTGTIVKVLIENGSPVEYDQPLFLVDPNG